MLIVTVRLLFTIIVVVGSVVFLVVVSIACLPAVIVVYGINDKNIDLRIKNMKKTYQKTFRVSSQSTFNAASVVQYQITSS